MASLQAVLMPSIARKRAGLVPRRVLVIREIRDVALLKIPHSAASRGDFSAPPTRGWSIDRRFPE
jgi:hypothetical protein